VDERYRPYEFAGGRIYLDVDESPAMRRRAEGTYEPAKVAALQRLLEPGMTFVDVGSNKGDFALIAARAMNDEGHVIAFEPSPENCGWIRKSIELNGYRSIELHELAMSDANGRERLYLGERSGWHSLVGDAERESIEVETRTLDSALGATPPDVLKVDVEGAELRVLRGAEGTLADTRLGAILIDVHPDRGVDPGDVCDALAAHGFNFRDPANIDAELTDPPRAAKEIFALRRQVA
jgi:FkbM family methyltransferase